MSVWTSSWTSGKIDNTRAPDGAMTRHFRQVAGHGNRRRPKGIPVLASLRSSSSREICSTGGRSPVEQRRPIVQRDAPIRGAVQNIVTQTSSNVPHSVAEPIGRDP